MFENPEFSQVLVKHETHVAVMRLVSTVHVGQACPAHGPAL